MLLIGRSLEEIVIGRDTVIVLLQHLRCHKLEKVCVDTSAEN